METRTGPGTLSRPTRVRKRLGDVWSVTVSFTDGHVRSPSGSGTRREELSSERGWVVDSHLKQKEPDLNLDVGDETTVYGKGTSTSSRGRVS